MFNYSAITIHQLDTKLDETEVAYQPMLAIWAIQIAISCGWYRKNAPPTCRTFFRKRIFAV